MKQSTPWWTHWKVHLKEAAVPLFMVVNLLAIVFFGPWLGLPEINVIISILRQWFSQYGLAIILLTGFIEALFMVGIYLPGSVAIFLGILVYAHSPAMLWLLTLYCWLSFMAAMCFNYALGYCGLYKIFNFLGAEIAIQQMKKTLNRWGRYLFLPASVHPNYLSVLVTCCGLVKMPFWQCMLLCGVAMAVSGPLLIFGFAQFIETIATPEGSNTLFTIFIGSFMLWATYVVANGFYQDYQNSKKG